MKIKRLLIPFLVPVLMFAFAACGERPGDDADVSNEGETAAAGSIDTADTGGSQDDGIIGDGSAAALPAAIPGTGKAASYAEAYEQLTVIIDTMNNTIDGIITAHDNAIEESDPDGYFNNPDYTGIWSFWALQSLDLAFTATLTDDPVTLEAVEAVYRMFDMDEVSAESPGAGKYIITYTSEAGEAVVEECTFDASTGSLSYVATRDGEVTYFYEFINLGNGQYAFQTHSDRALLGFDGTLLSLAYTTVYDFEGYTPFDHASESVFPGGSGVSESWVFARGTEGVPQAIKYDGTTLIIDMYNSSGQRHIEIAR